MKFFIIYVITLIASYGIGWKLGEIETGPERPVVHHMKEGFICITYRETMVCGQSTSTRPSQSDTSPDETLSVTYSMPLVLSYSTEF